jgi:hypothetical protein
MAAPDRFLALPPAHPFSPLAKNIPFHRELVDLGIEAVDLRPVVHAVLVDTIGKYRTQAVHRLPLPSAHLFSMHLVPGRYLLDRFVATQRLKRNPGLEIRCEPASFHHRCVPPQRVGIHVKSLSDFLGRLKQAYKYTNV